jgi:hypothetical protein
MKLEAIDGLSDHLLSRRVLLLSRAISDLNFEDLSIKLLCPRLRMTMSANVQAKREDGP